MISVVIATLNRADALNTYSLPSLLRQDNTNFEVIVWDASDDDDSRMVCEKFHPEFHQRNIELRYFKAQRRGLASQRNDSTTEIKGEVAFFIDDDCEISVDAINALHKCFASFPWVNGVGLPLVNKTQASGNSWVLKFAARLFGMRNNQFKRIINKAGGLSLPIVDLPGPAEWLSGGSMAFRKKVFDELKFDERLETFGGYALGEDVDFSHRVMLHFKEPLLIADSGRVIHHAASGGGREKPNDDKISSYFFNGSLIRNNFKKYGEKFKLFFIAWSNTGTILMLSKDCITPSKIYKCCQRARKQLAIILQK